MDWKKKIAGILSGMIIISSMTGCGDTIPTLTADENWKIAEYSAGLLLKYDAHNVRRLVSDEVIQEAYDAAYRKAEWEWKAQEYEELLAKEQEEANNNKGNSSSDEPMQQIVYTLEEILGIDGTFSLDYAGYEVCESYPSEDSEEFYAAMEAVPGKELMIVHYNLTNISFETRLCDILHSNASYTLYINDKKYGSQWTLLFDDFTQYYETLEPEEQKIVSIIFEVPKEDLLELTSLSLKVKSQEKSGKFTLW